MVERKKAVKRLVKRVKVRRRSKYLFRAVAVIMLLITAFLLLDARVRPMVRGLATVQAQSLAAAAANNAVMSILSGGTVGYDSLVTAEKDTEGKIISVKTDAMKMNLLRSQVNSAVSGSLSGLSGKELGIPLGNLTGFQLLSGRGPRLNVIISVTGSAETNFRNSFDSAGVNQTRHQIFMDTAVSMVIVLPTSTVTAGYQMSIIVAETILVGEVPSSYGNFQIGSGGISQK